MRRFPNDFDGEIASPPDLLIPDVNCVCYWRTRSWAIDPEWLAERPRGPWMVEIAGEPCTIVVRIPGSKRFGLAKARPLPDLTAMDAVTAQK